MEKKISYRQFMRALKKRTNADLIVSKYNKQEAVAFAEDIKLHGITCNCEKPLTYGVLSTKCYKCGHPLKQKS